MRSRRRNNEQGEARIGGASYRENESRIGEWVRQAVGPQSETDQDGTKFISLQRL